MGFDGFRIALTGLQASQQALQVISHNIANADTPGYTRQTAQLAAMPPLDSAGRSHLTTVGMVPEGVQVTSFTRTRADFVDLQLREQLGQQGEYQLKQDSTQNVEDMIGDPGSSGLQTILNQFWSAWQDVANDPTSMAARQTLAQNGDLLASTLQSARQSINTLQTDLSTQYNNAITTINTIATQVANLNTSIAKAVNSGEQPNDLYDQRDLLLDKLSGYADITYSSNSLQQVTVTMAGMNIVDPAAAGGTNTLTMAQVTGSLPATGQLKAYNDLTTTTLPGYIASLDTLAGSIITAVNAQHAAGFDLTGAAGGTFFNGTDASNIAVTPAVLGNPALIAASSSATAVGDGSNALAIGNIQLQNVTSGTTPGDFYRSFISQLGTDAGDASTKLNTI